MSSHRRILLLVLIMAGVAVGGVSVALFVLYEAAFGQQRTRLVEIARKEARTLEAVARFDAQNVTQDEARGPFDATLSQFRDAHEHFEGFGDTGEFTLAKRDGEQIVFLLRQRHGDYDQPRPIPFSSVFGEPMRRALSGESGTIVSLDYRGATVLAAYEPVEVLDLGVVAKIDIAEIRAPFIRAGLLSVGVSAMLLLVGTALFRRGRLLVAQLEESEKKYRTLFASATEGMFLVDGDLFEDCNERACELLGCQREDIIGHSPVEFAPLAQPDGRLSADVVPTVNNAALSGEVQVIDWQYRRLDGMLRHASVSVRLIEIEGRRRLLVSLHDVTAQKDAEEDLRQAHKMEAIGRLVAGVAHDFNKHLFPIIAYSDLLSRALDKNQKLRHQAEEINKAGERAATLVRQLLACSRKQVLAPKVVDLNAELLDLDDMLRQLLGEGVEFIIILGRDLWPVKVDPGQLGQVIINLVANARDAMPTGGNLTIETANVNLTADVAGTAIGALTGPCVLLSVNDSGTGMDKETLAVIFEPFYTTKEASKGIGLGLATVHGIVKQSGGHITVDSEPGCGTTFKVYLPREGAAT